jgi:hypothetical protein
MPGPPPFSSMKTTPGRFEGVAHIIDAAQARIFASFESIEFLGFADLLRQSHHACSKSMQRHRSCLSFAALICSFEAESV